MRWSELGEVFVDDGAECFDHQDVSLGVLKVMCYLYLSMLYNKNAWV